MRKRLKMVRLPASSAIPAIKMLPPISAELIKSVVEKYQEGLNASDFSKIRPLFAPNAVAEWNEKATVAGANAMEKPYKDLFAKVKFNTDFQYDAVDVYSDVAIVRTHHPVGQIELSRQDGSRKLDFNPEIFILKKIGPDWKSFFIPSRLNLARVNSESGKRREQTCPLFFRPV